MLLAIKTPEELDIPKVLAIYRESSIENCQRSYPAETAAASLEQYEAGYAAYMREEFFAKPGRLWMVETADGLWASALRLLPLDEPDTWMIGALETHPDHRRQGHAARLLTDTIQYLEQTCGEVTLLSGVGKRNTASLQTHLRCGFVREKESWTEGGVTNDRICTMVYRSPQGVKSTSTGASSSSVSGVTRQS